MATFTSLNSTNITTTGGVAETQVGGSGDFNLLHGLAIFLTVVCMAICCLVCCGAKFKFRNNRDTEDYHYSNRQLPPRVSLS